jgi:hypothetical protein
MPTIPTFDPPANINDVDSIPNQRAGWSEFLSNTFDANIEDVQLTLNPNSSQFFNPTRTDTDEPHIEPSITWIGFPALIARKHPGDARAARQEADTPLANGERPQDEYLEWFVTKKAGKITRVTFTCEGPEYWEALAHGYPLGYQGPKTAGATGDKQKLLQLYRQFVSPQVQLNDLFKNGVYNRLNKWNTAKGIMHLNQRNNTLGAEINIAAFATILRKNGGGQTITDADELIQCALFGAPGRASDPTIGASVNALARDGFSITLRNPVGLYIDNLNTAGWTKPNGQPIGSFFRIVRGNQGLGLRAVFEVPAAEGFVVGDIKIGGERIEFGGQIAEHITMKLVGIACRKNQIHNPAFDCVAGQALTAAAAAGGGQASQLATRASR